VLTPDGSDTVVDLTHHDLPPSELPSHQTGWTGLLKELERVAGKG